MRQRNPILLLVFSLATAFAADNSGRTFIMNYDLIITHPEDEEVYYTIQESGVRLSPDERFHGDDLGEIDYFFTISGLENNQGKLTIEIYQFKTRKKVSDVKSEIVVEVDFTLASPARFEGTNEGFGIDLAFSIDHE